MGSVGQQDGMRLAMDPGSPGERASRFHATCESAKFEF